MTKPFATILLLLGSVSLAGACSSTDNGVDGNNNTSGSPNNNTSGNTGVAGGNGGPVAGSPNGTAGVNGVAGSGGNTSVGGAGNTAGTNTGGVSTTGGMPGTGGVVNPGDGGPGYWVEKDWHGCAWTSPGQKGATTITPMDFTTKPAADAFCIKGVVGAEPMYESVALLGFNVNQPASTSCAAKAPDPSGAGEPSVVPTAEGIAVNFIKRGTDTTFTLRVQIQGPNGHKDGTAGAADRWCATIAEVQGKIFVPYSSFTPECWKAAGMRGTPYAKQPISAVAFSVPGEPTDTPFDFCVNGFTYGTQATDAPDGPATAGEQKGTVGSSGADGDFERAKVVVDGEQYIIQNNNWGNLGGELILSYVNNTFKITSGTGSGGDAPASFPSIYIGNNGNTKEGVYSTKMTDNLPIQIKNITSLPSTFRYSGTTGQFNATYDIWFANSIPTTEYKDGIDGFVMVWLRDPTGKQPIGGSPTATNVMVAGQPWNVFVGKRGGGGPNANATVVNFTNPTEDNDSRNQSFKNVDLKAFFTAAQTYGISPEMYLTDVFAGFEIWQGGAGGNLAVDEFKAVVNK
jgi:Glycosyl hydrolase family 12